MARPIRLPPPVTSAARGIFSTVVMRFFPLPRLRGRVGVVFGARSACVCARPADGGGGGGGGRRGGGIFAENLASVRPHPVPPPLRRGGGRMGIHRLPPLRARTFFMVKLLPEVPARPA